MYNKLLLLIPFILLVGCATEPPEEDDLPDLAQFELAEASVSVDRAIDSLAEINAEREILPIKSQTQEQLDYHMYQLASVDWTGPGEPLIRELAEAAGYHVRVIGKKPVYTGLVTIDKREVTVGELLRDVALQMQHYADVIVYPRSKLIEIHYLG